MAGTSIARLMTCCHGATGIILMLRKLQSALSRHWVTMCGSYSAMIAGGAGAVAAYLKAHISFFRYWRALPNQQLQLQPKLLRSMSGVFKPLSCWMGWHCPSSVKPIAGSIISARSFLVQDQASKWMLPGVAGGQSSQQI